LPYLLLELQPKCDIGRQAAEKDDGTDQYHPPQDEPLGQVKPVETLTDALQESMHIAIAAGRVDR
jgi:hypothetical protein